MGIISLLYYQDYFVNFFFNEITLYMDNIYVLIFINNSLLYILFGKK